MVDDGPGNENAGGFLQFGGDILNHEGWMKSWFVRG